MIQPPDHVIRWLTLAEKWAAAYTNLVPSMILASVWTESSGDPGAVNLSDPSYGLMGITMPIARAFGNVTVDTALLDPDVNMRCGSSFLSYLKRTYEVRFPNYAWVSAFNQGETNLLRGYKDPNYVTAWVSHLQTLDAAITPNVVNQSPTGQKA